MAEQNKADANFDLKLFSDAVAQLVAHATPGIVSVNSHHSRASGFIWRPGLIVTADETLAEEGDIGVTFADGKTLSGTLAGRDHATDIALLRVDDTARRPVSLSSSAVAAGSLAVTVGLAQGAPLVASGLVAFAGPPWRSLRGGEIDARIELDLRLRRAAEGGLALDAAGAAIGMAVRGPRQTLVIPSSTIERVAARLATHGRIARGYLGLALQPVRVGEGLGAMVMGVEAGGPGAAAGVHQGDVIVAWNGKPVEGVRALRRVLGPDSVGTTAELSIMRGGSPTKAKLTIAERPAA
jgi:S1-C subfamily serine protease